MHMPVRYDIHNCPGIYVNSKSSTGKHPPDMSSETLLAITAGLPESSYSCMVAVATEPTLRLAADRRREALLGLGLPAYRLNMEGLLLTLSPGGEDATMKL